MAVWSSTFSPAARSAISVTAPVIVPAPIMGTSLVPVIVIVTVWSSVARELSVALRLYVKVNSSSLAR